jgi:hypothetical protein
MTRTVTPPYRVPADRSTPPDHPPLREIPAVVTLIRERLDNLQETATHLRQRLAPALTTPPPSGALPGNTPRVTQLGGDIEAAIETAKAVGDILADILDRLEI